MTDTNEEVLDRTLAISSRMDALEDRRAAAAQRRIADTIAARLPKPLSDSDRAVIAAAQSRADKAYTAHSRQSPAPMSGETATAYRQRLIREWQLYSPAWKNEDLSNAVPQTLDAAEAEVYADAVAASYRPENSSGRLWESATVDSRTGRRVIEFHGRPRDWMSQFQHRRLHAKINRYPNATTPVED